MYIEGSLISPPMLSDRSLISPPCNTLWAVPYHSPSNVYWWVPYLTPMLSVGFLMSPSQKCFLMDHLSHPPTNAFCVMFSREPLPHFPCNVFRAFLYLIPPSNVFCGVPYLTLPSPPAMLPEVSLISPTPPAILSNISLASPPPSNVFWAFPYLPLFPPYHNVFQMTPYLISLLQMASGVSNSPRNICANFSGS